MLTGLEKMVYDEIKSRKEYEIDYTLESVGNKFLEIGYNELEITKAYKKTIRRFK